MDTPDKDEDDPVRPQVIDLEAEDRTGNSTEGGESQPAAPPRRAAWRSGLLWGALALAALAIFAGAWLYKDFGQRFWPSDVVASLAGRVDALDAAARTATSQIYGLGQDIDGMRAEARKLAVTANDAREAQAGLAELRDNAARLADRLDGFEAALKSAAAAIETLRKSTGGGGASSGGPDAGNLAGLEQRVAALETELAELKAKNKAAGPDPQASAVLSQALSDLKARFGAGAPFPDEFDRISRLVPAAPGLDLLAPHARTGLANAQGLAEELAALIPALPAPRTEPAPAEPGYRDWLLSQLASVITVRTLGEPDWRGLAKRAQAMAAAGNLAQAATLLDEAQGDLPAALNQWRARARARLGAERALEDVSAAVLRQLASLGVAP